MCFDYAQHERSWNACVLMDRTEKLGLFGAAAGHVVLFGLLSVGFLATPNPLKLKNDPLDVSLVSDVALESAAPQTTEEPATSQAPERGAPEDAAPPAPQQAAPAAPTPPPSPSPLSQPQKPVPPTQARPSPAPAKPAAGKPDPAATRPRGTRLGDDFLKGISERESPSRAQTPRGAVMSQQAMMSIVAAITRQIQPCANRQVTPGPGAERIRVVIRLKLNRDGTLAARPVIAGHDGVDEENQRYQNRVDDLAIATFVGCSPLRGLPDELYDVPNGWSSFAMRYKLPG